MNGANQAVSGGIGGFLAFFLLACALWLLMMNMNKRLQNVKYDEELRHQREAAQDEEGPGNVETGSPRPDGRSGTDGQGGARVGSSGSRPAAPSGK
ncbi:hypothetical protein [Austwickia chelonae]|uniref:hypothetical protein n=1 Tax=Austwickia chelonae TaxID=100225 RepID=UPI000E266B5D|nr:hypothetical protein [Austwickia chelonae]